MAALAPDVVTRGAEIDLGGGGPPHPGVSFEAGPSRLRRFFKSLELWLPVGILIFIVLVCFLWPEIHTIPAPINGNLLDANLPFFTKSTLYGHHILGTDTLGNDIMSEILYGGRTSMEVGLGVAVIGFGIGGTLGVIAGYMGGALEAVVMRILDMFLAFPALVIAITIVTYLGQSEMHVIWAIAFFAIPAYARLSRATTLRIKDQTFIVASRLSGASDKRILFKHIAPNVAPQLLTFSFLGIGVYIIVEATLSFLGYGLPSNVPSWGKMIANGQIFLATEPRLVLVPSACLFILIISLNLTSDALRARWGSQ
jgi:peptide/nickel transport system permease protein